MGAKKKFLLPALFIGGIAVGLAGGLAYMNSQKGLPTETAAAITPTPSSSASPSGAAAPTLASPAPNASPTSTPSAPASNPNPDLTPDAGGMSRATVIVTTTQGVIKFKLYPKDAPNTVKRIIELVNQGFYNGLAFHRVVPGFVIQGGDPLGSGKGGSGQTLKAEFNDRRHVEGTVAMARAGDPDSADSQFYVSLGTHPHLDHSYTVFGQVIEGMDVARKIKVGDKMTSVIVE
jgi:peptidylprolyl isomerase/peptidyl-prolyl cis-trans isomerase B (cyclophilin B)